MTHDADTLRAECTLAVARCLEADPAVLDPWAFACAMFFAGVDAQAAEPRPLIVIETELAQLRSRRAVADAPARDVTAFTRRKDDAEDAALAADLEEEAQRARAAQLDRERERRQRAAAKQRPWE